MRPLYHLGIGAGSEDYRLFEELPVLYDELHKISNEKFKKMYDEFMGDYTDDKIPVTKSDMDKKIEFLLKEKNRLLKTKNKKIKYNEFFLAILDAEIENIDIEVVKLYNAIKSKTYSKLSKKSIDLFNSRYNAILIKWQDQQLAIVANEIGKENEKIVTAAGFVIDQSKIRTDHLY